MFSFSQHCVNRCLFNIVHSERGQLSAPTLGILVIGLLAGVGLIVDAGNAFRVKHMTQTIVDSALIGCGEWFMRNNNKTEAELEECMSRVFDVTLKKNELENTIVCEENVAARYVADLESNPQTISITCSVDIPNRILGKLPGQNISSLSSAATAGTFQLSGGSQLLSVALVLDYSGSIGESERNAIQEAVMNVLTPGQGLFQDGDKISITTFGKGYNGIFKNVNGIFGSGWIWVKNMILLPTTVGSETYTDVNALLDDINANAQAWQRGGSGGTYGQGALYFARKLLEDDANSYSRAIIFLSDGELNSASPYPVTATPTQYGPWGTQNTKVGCGESCGEWPGSYPDDTFRNRNSSDSELGDYATATDADECAEDASNNRIYCSYGYNDTSIPELDLNYVGICEGTEWGTTLAAEQADLARNEGIEVFTICTGCSNANKARTMQRLGADATLPSTWQSDFPDAWWRDSGEGTENVKQAYQPGVCTPYNNTYFDWESEVEDKPNRVRYYRVSDSGATVTMQDAFEGIIRTLKGGKLTQ